MCVCVIEAHDTPPAAFFFNILGQCFMTNSVLLFRLHYFQCARLQLPMNLTSKSVICFVNVKVITLCSS